MMSDIRMEKCYQEQLGRIDRLMAIIEADNPHNIMRGLLFYDILIFACQSIWHLKDWVINDPEFGAKDKEALKNDIHSARCLLTCSDLANGSKHLLLSRPKRGARFSELQGVDIDTRNGIYQELYYVVCSDPADEFHGIEVRTLLRRCRNTWDRIINCHYLSEFDASL